MHVFSDVGATVLWRAAAPTVSSFVATPRAWAAMRSSPAELSEIIGEYTYDDVPSDMEDLAFYATAWLAFANYAVELARKYPERVTIVNYDDMCSSFPAFINWAVKRLGITAMEPTMQKMLSLTRFYAKDASGHAEFNPAADHARPVLGGAEADLVDRICGATEAILQKITTRPEAPGSGRWALWAVRSKRCSIAESPCLNGLPGDIEQSGQARPQWLG